MQLKFLVAVSMVLVSAYAETALKSLAEISNSDEAPQKIHATGKRESLEKIVNGKIEGRARYYHPNGQLYGVIEYKDGKKTGTHTLYREDGTKEQELSYKDGQVDGTCRWFDAKGMPWKEAEYKSGVVIANKNIPRFEPTGCRGLGAAVSTRNLEKVRECLKAKADPNVKFGSDPILTDTLTWGLSQIAEELLKAGANPNALTSDGKPMILRLGFGHGSRDEDLLAVAKLLTKFKVKWDDGKDLGQNLVQSLTMRKLPKTLEYVLERVPQSVLQVQLENALEYGDLPTIQLYLNKGVDPNGEKAIWKVMHYGPDAHRLAVIQSPKFDKKNPKWLTMAAYENRTDIIKELIKKGVDLNGTDEGHRTALLIAIENDKVEVVKTLLAAGAKTDLLSSSGYGSLHGETALCLASRKGRAEFVDLLIAAKADVNANCGSVLEATQGGFAPIVAALIKAGADVKDRYTGHWRALFAAAESDRSEIGEMLLKAGTKVDMRGDNDCTPLMIAASKGSLKMIRLLVANKADLEATNAQRMVSDVGSNFVGTPLAWAIDNKQEAAAKLLRELGAKK